MATFARPRAVTIAIDDARRVSGLLQAPKNARACYVLAHGAGAGMSHPFMAAVVDGLAERGIATLPYQFPYMEQGSKRPDGVSWQGLGPADFQSCRKTYISTGLVLGVPAVENLAWRCNLQRDSLVLIADRLSGALRSKEEASSEPGGWR